MYNDSSYKLGDSRVGNHSPPVQGKLSQNGGLKKETIMCKGKCLQINYYLEADN